LREGGRRVAIGKITAIFGLAATEEQEGWHARAGGTPALAGGTPALAGGTPALAGKMPVGTMSGDAAAPGRVEGY